jgi:TIR domain-containing protein
VSYKYSFDRRALGTIILFKETFEFFHRGLIRLRDRLDAWNKREQAPPYAAEVEDLNGMIEWGAERLPTISREIRLRDVTVGSLRYLKAGGTLLVLEAEEQLQQEAGALPSGVIETRKRDIARMKELCDVGSLASLEPADCLWEIAPSPHVRTPATRAQGEPLWDVFICHASEDKEPFVQALADRLVKADVRVWLDTLVLKLGDSLRRSIEKGLSSSRFGAVILSPRFFAKEWPQKELDGMAALEIDGRKVILPVWHELGANEVRRYSPMLADRVAIGSDKGLDAVVREILDVLQPKAK